MRVFLEICSLFSFIDSLRKDSAKAVIVLDFTKFGIVDEGNVHCFVVAVLSRGTDEDAKSGKWRLFLTAYLKSSSLISSRLEATDPILWLRCAEYWQTACEASLPVREGVIFLVVNLNVSFRLNVSLRCWICILQASSMGSQRGSSPLMAVPDISRSIRLSSSCRGGALNYSIRISITNGTCTLLILGTMFVIHTQAIWSGTYWFCYDRHLRLFRFHW